MADVTKGELIGEEDEAWAELRASLAPLGPELMLEDGFHPDWSVKDLLAHLACWLAEAAQALQQIRLGTYTRKELDEDEMNRRFWESCRDLDLHDVWAQLHSARGRMLEELDLLPLDGLDEQAAGWFRESGAQHYRDHLPRLREWLVELEGR